MFSSLLLAVFIEYHGTISTKLIILNGNVWFNDYWSYTTPFHSPSPSGDFLAWCSMHTERENFPPWEFLEQLENIYPGIEITPELLENKNGLEQSK